MIWVWIGVIIIHLISADYFRRLGGKLYHSLFGLIPLAGPGFAFFIALDDDTKLEIPYSCQHKDYVSGNHIKVCSNCGKVKLKKGSDYWMTKKQYEELEEKRTKAQAYINSIEYEEEP